MRTARETGSVQVATSSVGSDNPLVGIEELAAQICRETDGLRRALPEVANEVLELSRRPECDAAGLEKLISKDPFVSAQLLATANSAMFAPRTPVLTVKDAVVRLGISTVRDIVTMVVVNSTMFRVPGFETRTTAMCQRSQRAAVAARSVAKCVPALAVPDAFLIGFLHDIGEMVLLERCVRAGIIKQGTLTGHAAVQVLDRLTRHHTAVGAATCRAWKMPATVVSAAEFHHDYRSEGRIRPAAALAAASDVVVQLLGPAAAGVSAIPPAQLTAFSLMGISPEQAQAVIAETLTATRGA